MRKSLTALTVILGWCVVSTATFAETRSQTKEREAAEQQARLQRKLTKVLQGERMGVIPDRQKALKALIDSGNAPDEAYWQAGYIKKGDQWVSVEDRWLSREEETKLDEYAKVRNPAWNTPEANYDLAKWCDQHGLQAQARAHLMSILLDHPDNAELRQMLGYQKIGNRWMNEQEFNAAVEAAERLAKNLQKWGPVVAEIRKGLDSDDERKQNSARVKLEQFDDLDALPALEFILLSDSEQSANAYVNHLGTIKHREATLALCRAVMLLPENSESVKYEAIEELKTRPLEDYVPVILSQMQSPLTAQFCLINNVWMEYSHGPFNMPKKYSLAKFFKGVEFHITTENLYEIRNYSYRVIFRDWTIHNSLVMSNRAFAYPKYQQLLKNTPPNWSRFYFVGRVDTERPLNDQLNEYREDLLDANRMIREQNDSISAQNDKATSLLGLVTNQSQYESPEFWWRWWKDRIEVDPTQKLERNLVEVVEFETPLHLPGSCFIAGTPVWTDRGPRPIEELHIGDMALTKDVDTGELSYKPIIRTTVREPRPLTSIDLGPEQITATGGHPFWVSGTGWVRARELKPGQRLHTPTGSIEIENVTEADERETFNLVVDGFHTYFVGQSQLLCHDVSITSPTDAVVPGLIER